MCIRDSNWNGQLGQNQNAYASYSSPVQIPGNTWDSVSRCYYAAMSIKTDGTLWAWGRNQKGELGQNDRTDKSSPVQIPGTTWSSNSMYLSTGDKCCLAIKTDGTMWVWGDNSEGQLGDDSVVHRSSPVQVGSATDWIATSATLDSSFAIQLDQTP